MKLVTVKPKRTVEMKLIICKSEKVTSSHQ